MNVRRFAARTSREALAMVREALGEDAVVLSTKPSADGVEVLAMAPDGLQEAEASAPSTVLRAPRPAGAVRPRTLAERIAARGEPRQDGAPRSAAARALASAAALFNRAEPQFDPAPPAPMRAATGNPLATARAAASRPAAARPAAVRPAAPSALDADIDPRVARDVETLGMSTLTFQDYVRERMLRRRQAELEQSAPKLPEALVPPEPALTSSDRAASADRADRADRTERPMHAPLRVIPGTRRPEPMSRLTGAHRDAPVLRDTLGFDDGPSLADDDAFMPPQRPSRIERALADERTEVMGELRQVRHLIEERFGMLAYMERMQRDPRQVSLLQKLFDTGLSPGMVRKLAQALPADAPDEMAWAANVLERNLLTAEHEAPLEDHEGVLALIGPTGVGKTTTTAKIAAAFAARHGAANLGLITLDAYRVAAHEQLRTYGRILGVPVHTAHDRASLEDLMGLLSSKKLVLIDTAGVAQRDSRTRELLEMLSNRVIDKVLVVNAAVQGETVEDVMAAYGSASCKGVILSKLDEAVKLGPALDALIRQRATVLGVTNGQRVPEDWHRLSASALVQRALRGGGSASWRLDANEVNLVFAATHGNGYPAGVAAAPAGGLHA